MTPRALQVTGLLAVVSEMPTQSSQDTQHTTLMLRIKYVSTHAMPFDSP